nr:uncharacterized protein LOC106844359 isoform X3 [Equus asinus]
MFVYQRGGLTTCWLHPYICYNNLRILVSTILHHLGGHQRCSTEEGFTISVCFWHCYEYLKCLLCCTWCSCLNHCVCKFSVRRRLHLDTVGWYYAFTLFTLHCCLRTDHCKYNYPLDCASIAVSRIRRREFLTIRILHLFIICKEPV